MGYFVPIRNIIYYIKYILTKYYVCSMSIWAQYIYLNVLLTGHYASTVLTVEFLLWYASSRCDKSCTMSLNTTESTLSPSTYSNIQSPSFDRRTMFPMACRLINRNRMQNRYTRIRGDTIMMNLNDKKTKSLNFSRIYVRKKSLCAPILYLPDDNALRRRCLNCMRLHTYSTQDFNSSLSIRFNYFLSFFYKKPIFLKFFFNRI